MGFRRRYRRKRTWKSKKRFRRGRKAKKGGLLTGGKRLSRLPGKRRAINLPGIKTLVAPTLFTKMYWSVWDYIATTTGSVSYHTIRLSSIYDPGYSWSVGPKNTSSRGFTVASPLYSQYRVYGVKVYLKIWNASNCDVLVQLSSNAATTPSNISDVDIVQRQEGSISRILPRVASGNDKTSCVFKVFIPIAKTLGMTKEQYRTDGNTVSLMNNSPAVNAFMHLSAWNIHTGGVSSGAAQEVDVMQFGDFAAAANTSTSAIGYSLRMVQSVQFIRRVGGTAA